MKKSDILKLRFTNGGQFRSEGEWIHGIRTIDSYEIIIVTKGVIYMFQGDKEYTVKSGEYLLLSPDTVHGGRIPSESHVEFYWLHFKEDENGIRLPQGFDGLPVQMPITNMGSVLESVHRLLHCSETAGYDVDICQHIMYVLFAELIFESSEKSTGAVLSAAVHEYIRAHSAACLTAKSVSEHFGYHSDYLSRMLKKSIGRSLQQDINTERINLAKLYLQTTDFNISRIAFELGYADANLFEKFFRYHTKMTPKTYRQSFINRHTNHK